MKISEKLTQKLIKHCWSATSKLESQVIRNPELPESYAKTVENSFSVLRELQDSFLNQADRK